MKLCDYGCGRIAIHYFKSTDNWCCETSTNRCPAIREKISKILKSQYKSGKRKIILPTNEKENGIRKCTQTLRKRLKEKYDKLPFKEKPDSERRRILLKEQKYKCAKCNLRNI